MREFYKDDWISNYLLISLFAISLFHDPNFLWIGCLLMLLAIYKIIWWTAGHFTSVFNVNRFFKDFLSDKKTYNLEPMQSSSIKIRSIDHFSNLIYTNYISKSVQGKELFKVPLYVMYADCKNKNTVLGACKAYLYLGGLNIIVCRSKTLNSNPFEEFLFYHELEHINDNGLLNLRTSSRHLFRLFLHTVFLVYITSIYHNFLPFLILFIIFHVIYFFYDVTAQRESIADAFGIYSLKDTEKQQRVMDYLNRLFQMQLKSKKGFYSRFVTMRRILNLKIYQEIFNYEDEGREELHDLVFSNPKEVQYRNFDLITFIVTLIILWKTWNLVIDPAPILKILAIFCISYLILFTLSILLFSYRSQYIRNCLEESYKNYELVPFNIIEYVGDKDIASLLKSKYK